MGASSPGLTAKLSIEFLGLVALTVGFQTRRAARANPVESLRDE